ncbi:putative mitochondrial carrier domain-containing protein [Rosa chinensis]|uniref:Putative mitochondrial carrier domain-containing protein n=1 Tax=Rosa chinensis TaxID=74649 RepID=A0A2P6QNL0_ROSCH|nr:mitochondrial dicarboxylate/tricarboxylate transporter DTC isoform X1 [Rosa chinensis]PRQ35747.1 putative mitochondrial carrier domain-containing protein [Rosa chinensis]
MKIMEEKKDRTEFEGLKPFWGLPPPPSVLKPFVHGGVAGLLTGSINGAMEYSGFHILKNVPLFRNHPTYVPRWIFVKIIPGLVLIDALAYSQLLGIYEILRRRAIAANEGMQPRLYQEAACGLIAGAAGTCVSFPLYLGLYRKRFESMGDAAGRWRLRSNLSHIFRYGSVSWKRRVGLGMGMVASYKPSLHYLVESRGFSEEDAKSGAGAISALSAAACAVLAPYACSLVLARETLRSRGPLGFLTGLSGLCFHEAPKVMVFWAVFEELQKYSKPSIESEQS